MASFNYVMSPTGKLFHESDKFLKMLCGPYGSGKSCACAVDVLSYACAQAPASDGVRYTRVGVIRAAYPELQSTTRRSLMEVLPDEYGSIAQSGAPIRGFYYIPLPDGTFVHLELELISLKNQDDEFRVRSMNWTFAWMNEANGCSPEVFTMVTSRIGRYPSQDLGGVTWGGVIMDFNQPEPGSWLDVFMKNPQPNWAVFRQPPAAFKHIDDQGRVTYEVNPNAENLRNLGSKEEGDDPNMTPEERGMRYYRNQIDANLKSGRYDVVDNQFCMMDVPVVDGKPVYPDFNARRHVSADPIKPFAFEPVLIGMDQSGIHPAAVLVQNQYGKWCVLDELYADNEGLENFLYGMLLPLLRTKYQNNPIIAAIDPSNQRDSWQAVTPKQRLEELGITSVTEYTNAPKIRIQMVEHMLNLETGGILIDPACQLLIRGFQSEYRYRRLRATGSIGASYTPQPEKNDASHIHDALQYAALLIHQRKEPSENLKDVAEKLAGKRRILNRIV